LQNYADSVIFCRRVYGFCEAPASVSWYDGVAKRPGTDEDNKDAGDVAEGDTIHILAPYSRRTSALARRCDGRSADCASPAIRQRARPDSDRDVPAKLVPACRACPPAERAALARSFIAKAVFNLPTTRLLIDMLSAGLPGDWGCQTTTAACGSGSLAGWNLCPKPEPSVPL